MKNKESLLQYMEQVHSGVKGEVTDGSTGQPVQNARVQYFQWEILNFISTLIFLYVSLVWYFSIYFRLSLEEIVKFSEQQEMESIGGYWYLETTKWL